ncbi:MAG: alanine:cation symporter family protein [Chitinophagales bacterium]|nr:alanine:cation symporter family protein [Chitinophagales bacterium]
MKIILFLCLTFLSLLTSAQEVKDGLDKKLNDAFDPIASWWENLIFYSIPIGSGNTLPIVLIILIGAATFFTFYFNFVNVRKFKLAIDIVRGKYTPPKSEPQDDHDHLDTIQAENIQGEVSHFQALTAALSATVGLGNIAGVAIAIAIGGPGATFWMILAGLIGMSSKFVECTLGVKYREVDANGVVFGGPMYYLKKGLAEKGLVKIGKILAVVFAVMCIGGSFGGGNMFQANQAAAQFIQLFDVQSGWIGTAFGVLLAALVFVVIVGGIKGIARVTEKIVPFMAVLYVIAALIIIVLNINYLPAAVSSIITGAFKPIAIAGGFVGVLIQGFRRAAFSNEAGVGSAAIAHSAVRTSHPVSEGLVSLLEPFVDTVVICTMTALVIVFYNMDNNFTYGNLAPNNEVIMNTMEGTLGGVELTSIAFNSAIPGFSILLTLAVILFAFSTMLSWSYYGLQSWKYLFGRSKIADISYKLLFCLFVILGAAAQMDAVVKFSDAMIFAMIFPNAVGLIILAPKVKEELKNYISKIKSGEIKRY